MANELSQNQIVPAARPVDTFIRPATPNVAAPAAPQMMPNPQGIRMIPQASGGSVEGFNQFQELAIALRPFSEGLTDLAGIGMKVYAGNEYEKGRSEAMRAQVLANQQMLQSQAEYAGENRKLAQADPIGALMMDRVNPYREAGRQNALSRIAGQEIQRAVLNKYRNTPDAYQWPIDSPKLKQLEAEAVDEVTKKYRLDSGSPGFIENVLPQIGQASQRLYETHVDAYTKYQKETAWRNTAVEMAAIYQRARETGVVEWQEFDSATGRAVRRTAMLSQDRASWERGLRVSIAQAADRLANETGIPGEASGVLKRQAFERLAEMAELAGSKGAELKRILAQTDGGPINKDGQRALVGDLYGIDIFESSNKIGQAQWQQQQRQTDQGVQQFQSELADVTYGKPDGPMRGQAIDDLMAKYERLGVPRAKLMEGAASISKTLDEVAGRGYDASGADSLLQDMQAREGSAWNATQADREFEATLANVAPQERANYRKQYADIRKGKEREKDDVPTHLVDPLINRTINARVKQFYASDATEAALRGADITQMLAYGDADIAESQRRQQTAYRRHVYSRLRDAAAKKGAKLDAAEVTAAASQALQEYGKNDAESFNYLFPGSKTDEPSVSGRAKPPAPAGGQAKPAAPVYPSGQLDNIPDRSQRLKAGEPVLALPSVQEEVQRVLNGQTPSAAAARAARDAGFGGNVGRWLLREADGYPSFTIPNDARKQLLKSSNDAQGAADAMRVASARSGAVQSAARWFFDALTGTAPAYAAPTTATMSPRPMLGNSSSAGPRGSAGSWDNVVAMARAKGAKFPELVAAQWALESDWGRSPSGRNNYFGQKGPGTSRATREVVNGREVSTTASFTDFASPSDSVGFLVQNWYQGRGGANNAKTVEEAARILKRNGYATDPDYVNKLLRIVRGNRRT